jgi:IMP dehydrogenase
MTTPFPLYLTFDDVALVPRYNNINSRTEPDTSSWLTKNIKTGIPIVPANMDTVIGDQLANVIVNEYKGIVIFHRFCSQEIQLQLVKKYAGHCFISCGLNPNMDNIRELYNAGALGVCIDIAHGHSSRMINLIRELKTLFPNKDVIAGNICTAIGYQDLVNAGADAVKVGIGPGAACTTRVVTGFGCPQFSAIYEIAKLAKALRVPIIADGGIRNSRDMVLAIAAGASTVMIGSLFAKTIESASPKFDLEGNSLTFEELVNEKSRPYNVKYRGQASKDFQDEYYGGMKEKTVAEGIAFTSQGSGHASSLIDDFLGGYRSALTYGGARDIKELQRKAEFVQVTQSYISESFPRKNQ